MPNMSHKASGGVRFGVGLVAVLLGFYPPHIFAQASTTQWTITASPNASANLNRLAGVSCPTTDFCEAVGHYYNGSVDQNLIERWDGTKWAVTHVADTSTSRDNDLNAVSCVSSSFCMAAGTYSFDASSARPLAARWDGTAWQLLRPRTAGSLNHLRGINCRSASFCFAVGDYYDGSQWRALVERWDGIAWSVIPSPTTAPDADSFLTGISCSSTTFCMASSTYYNGAADQTLIETWDGATWHQVNSPNRDQMTDQRAPGVACTKPSFCMAVGASSNGSFDQTLAEGWDGAAWHIVTTPNADTFRDNYLASVTCRSMKFCVAVGGFYNGSATQPLIERWNGTTWALMSPAPASSGNYDLFGVSCSNSSDCFAVGSGARSGGLGRTLIEHWVG